MISWDLALLVAVLGVAVYLAIIVRWAVLWWNSPWRH